ncbi:AAA family ATPase [Tundrisphaera sp. TA3]|uniref:AAA family ATPase n=1 Tax=Tundrisphaera sp. TA3 TaxID=3435775 RepID=UPI003EB7CBD5
MPAFIVADSESTGSRIRDVLGFKGLECPSSHVMSSADAAIRLGRETGVDLIVLALPADRQRGLALLPTLARIAPGNVLAVGPADDARVVLQALRSGAADFVDSADLEVELEAALGRLSQSKAPVAPGRLIAVLGPCGGCGASTLAVNLAVCLAKSHNDVGLIDMKLESGDLASLMDLRANFTLADLCHNAARLDRVMFEKSMVKHDSGVHLLVSPHRPADVQHVKPDCVGMALTLARTAYPRVVVDVDHTFREEQAVVLRQADIVLVVLRLDFAALRNARKTLEYLDGIEVARDKVRLVVNRLGQPQEVPLAKAEEALGRKIAHQVPDEPKTINRAGNLGIPAVIHAPSAKVSRSLSALAAAIEAPARKT